MQQPTSLYVIKRIYSLNILCCVLISKNKNLKYRIRKKIDKDTILYSTLPSPIFGNGIPKFTQQNSPAKSTAHYLGRKKKVHFSPAHTVFMSKQVKEAPLVSHKPDSHKLSVQTLLSESNIDSRSISSNSNDEVFLEVMPRSTAKTLIHLIVLSSKDALTILYPLVDTVAEKSQFSTSSSKLKLLSSHKEIQTNLAQDLGISTSLDVTYTYIYLFNPFLVVMAEEIIIYKSKKVYIVVENSDSTQLKKKRTLKKMKKSDSVVELNFRS